MRMSQILSEEINFKCCNSPYNLSPPPSPTHNKTYNPVLEGLKSLSIYQQLRSFLLLCKILYHFKSLTPSKSVPPKNKIQILIYGLIHLNPCVLTLPVLEYVLLCVAQREGGYVVPP